MHIGRIVEREDYQVVRTYCGHGIGSLFHTRPNTVLTFHDHRLSKFDKNPTRMPSERTNYKKLD